LFFPIEFYSVFSHQVLYWFFSSGFIIWFYIGLSPRTEPDSLRLDKLIARITTSDFPRYFVAVTRARRDSGVIDPRGITIKSTVVPNVQVVFPKHSVNKETKVALQVLFDITIYIITIIMVIIEWLYYNHNYIISIIKVIIQEYISYIITMVII